jgi:hypothetical protein
MSREMIDALKRDFERQQRAVAKYRRERDENMQTDEPQLSAVNDGRTMKLTIEGDPQHLYAIRNALDLYMRCSLGQFKAAADLHDLDYYTADAAGRAMQAIVMPSVAPNAHYAIGSSKVSTQAKVCYEVWKLLGGGTSGEPLELSGVPFPKITVENVP